MNELFFFRPWVYNLTTAYGLHVPHFTVCVSCSAGHALVLGLDWVSVLTHSGLGSDLFFFCMRWS